MNGYREIGFRKQKKSYELKCQNIVWISKFKFKSSSRWYTTFTLITIFNVNAMDPMEKDEFVSNFIWFVYRYITTTFRRNLNFVRLLSFLFNMQQQQRQEKGFFETFFFLLLARMKKKNNLKHLLSLVYEWNGFFVLVDDLNKLQ